MKTCVGWLILSVIFAWSVIIIVEIKLHALETRVTQLEQAAKSQALVNQSQVQLREQPEQK